MQDVGNSDEKTDGQKTAISQHDSSYLNQSAPEDPAEQGPDPSYQQQAEVKKQKKVIWALCKRKWKAIKSTFSHPRRTEVVPLSTQLDHTVASLDHTAPEDPAELQTDPSNNIILSQAEIQNMFQHVSDLSLSRILKEKVQTMNVILEIRSRHYKINKMLGEGGYGAVFEAIRVSDGFKVAVKVAQQEDCLSYCQIHGYSKPLPREIAFHMLASKDSAPEILQLLDWEDWDKGYIMVLECPSPCMDLSDFYYSLAEDMQERLVLSIMWQTTNAAMACLKKRVFHRDIKLENLLINPETYKVKLIDFGCSELLQKTPYTTYFGTEDYCCPEFFSKGEYHAKPATVWSLGILMYFLLFGTFPDTEDLNRIQNKKWRKAGLTKECCSLIHGCLQKNPKHRITLQKIKSHSWFNACRNQ